MLNVGFKLPDAWGKGVGIKTEIDRLRPEVTIWRGHLWVTAPLRSASKPLVVRGQPRTSHNLARMCWAQQWTLQCIIGSDRAFKELSDACHRLERNNSGWSKC